MQSHGGAHVNGDTDQGRADGPLVRIDPFDDEMLFALRDKSSSGHRRETDAPTDKIFRRDSLVPKIETKASRSGMTDDSGEEKGGGLKGKVIVIPSVARVP